MNNFTFYTPTKVVFGKDTEEKAGSLVKEQGAKKVLIHYGKGSVIKSGLLEKVKSSLQSENISFVELGGVLPNPRLALVYEGITLCKKENVDFILAVGGGSVIDSAKAIGYGLANEGDVWDFYEHTRMPTDCMPLGVILTIAASGSEMSNSSVITNEDGLKKRGCNCDVCRPKFAIMNPLLTMTLPDYQTMCGCTDILMHTLERYFVNGGNLELTDALAEGLLKTVMQNTLTLKDNPSNYEARAEIMWAGSLSHNGLTGCGTLSSDFATHRLEHELSGLYDVAHGAGLSALWPSWARYVYKNCLHRFCKFALNVMNVPNVGSREEIALKGIEALEAFFKMINMPVNLRELGVTPTEDELTLLAKKCANAVGGKIGSAKVLEEPDMLAIYKMAL